MHMLEDKMDIKLWQCFSCKNTFLKPYSSHGLKAIIFTKNPSLELSYTLH